MAVVNLGLTNQVFPLLIPLSSLPQFGYCGLGGVVCMFLSSGILSSTSMCCLWATAVALPLYLPSSTDVSSSCSRQFFTQVNICGEVPSTVFKETITHTCPDLDHGCFFEFLSINVFLKIT